MLLCLVGLCHPEAEVAGRSPRRTWRRSRPTRPHPGPGCVRPGDGALVRALRRAGHGGRHARRAAALGALREQLPQVRFVSGAFGCALVEGTAMRAVFRSPGLSRARRCSCFGSCARAMGLWVDQASWSLFPGAGGTESSAAGYAPAVLAVTGTNGKTTVTSLTGQLVERAANRGRGRQHRPHAAGHAGRRSMTARLPRCGCWSCRAFSWTASRLRAHGRHGAERHAGPSGLARRHGRPMPLPRRASLAAGPDGAQPRRPAGDEDAARAVR
jgi:hypothetical protein